MVDSRDPRKRKQRLYQPRNYRQRRYQELMQMYAAIYGSGVGGGAAAGAGAAGGADDVVPSYILDALARYFDS